MPRCNTVSRLLPISTWSFRRARLNIIRSPSPSLLPSSSYCGLLTQQPRCAAVYARNIYRAASPAYLPYYLLFAVLLCVADAAPRRRHAVLFLLPACGITLPVTVWLYAPFCLPPFSRMPVYLPRRLTLSSRYFDLTRNNVRWRT